MNKPTSRILISMPMLMGRKALKRLDDGSYVQDTDWYDRTLRLYESLFQFLSTNGLLRSTLDFEAIKETIITSEDLTEDGRRLWETGAVYKWLGSFDRSPEKKFEDYRLLEKALSKAPRK